MQSYGDILRRLMMLLRRKQFDRDLEEEIRLHLELREREHREKGIAPEDAHYATLKRFGSTTLIKEVSREMWGWNSIEQLTQDVRHGLRTMLRSPGFTAVAVLALALGMGANAAIFSVMNTVLFRSLPYPDPDKLISVWETDLKRNIRHLPASFTKFTDLAEQSQVFAGIGAYTWGTFDLAGGQAPEQVYGVKVSQGFFPAFGVRPELGRWFLPEEDRRGGRDVVVIANRLWQRRFSSDPNLIGKNIGLDGRSALTK